jgi:hypothetical protein
MPKIPRAKNWLWLGGLVLFAAAIDAAGCGGGAPSRESARDQATTDTCERFSQCGDIGAGETYPSESNCELQWQDNWDNAWPAAVCEGRIDQAQLTTCLAAIRGTDCASFGDFVTTLAKCDKMHVCDAPADAGGGG